MNNNVNSIDNFRFRKGGLEKGEMKFIKEYRGKDIIKMSEMRKVGMCLFLVRGLDNYYRAGERKLSKQNIINFLKKPKSNVNMVLNDHQASIIANIYMKYRGN